MMEDSMSADAVLVVVAHPDDEVLGCGGAMAAWAAAGRPVHVLILADGVTSRDGGAAHDADGVHRRGEAAREAGRLLGVASVRLLGLPDNRLDAMALLDVAKHVEDAVRAHVPATIVTHHGGDLNVDHRAASEAVAIAARPQPGSGVREVLFFETPSSTEWRLGAAAAAFQPNWFIDISGHLDAKLQALRTYAEELRPFPHPRSEEAVTALAQWRGASCGVPAAEAFVLGRHLALPWRAR
ncbi:MAG TPA: PIG-L family deacetylase [Longimicrobiales bacterium]|nr:PIG-L family deacetylase [Longimicrobiales bacterium]